MPHLLRITTLEFLMFLFLVFLATAGTKAWDSVAAYRPTLSFSCLPNILSKTCRVWARSKKELLTLRWFKFIFFNLLNLQCNTSLQSMRHHLRRHLNAHVTSWFSGVNGCDSLMSITLLCCYLNTHTHTHWNFLSDAVWKRYWWWSVRLQNRPKLFPDIFQIIHMW